MSDLADKIAACRASAERLGQTADAIDKIISGEYREKIRLETVYNIIRLLEQDNDMVTVREQQIVRDITERIKQHYNI